MTTPVDRRAAILLIAAEVFATYGFAAAPVRRIAERCGLSPGTLFHHYASKRELLVDVVAEGTVRTQALVEERLAGVSDPRLRLETLVVGHLEALHGASRPFTVVATQEFHLLEPDERARVVTVRDAYERLWQGVLDEAAAAGLVSTDPLLRLFLLGAVNQTFFWYSPTAGISIDELGSRFAAMVMDESTSEGAFACRSELTTLAAGLI